MIISLSRSGITCIFALDGTLLNQWDSHINLPRAIAVDEDEIFITDSKNDRVVVFSRKGILLRQWGTKGSKSGQFIEPNGIAIYKNMLYVVDSGNNRVQVFNRNGKFLFEWTFPDPNVIPRQLAIANDKVFITSEATEGVYVFELW